MRFSPGSEAITVSSPCNVHFLIGLGRIQLVPIFIHRNDHRSQVDHIRQSRSSEYSLLVVPDSICHELPIHKH